MLKVEHSINYFKKGRSSSETFEGAKHVKQIISQRKTLRFKRSDDNPELPENFKVGQAIGGGDCFFDSVAKGLKQLKPEMDFTVKSLREVCKRFAQSQLENDQSWLKGALRNEAEPISVYVPRIEFTADDIEQKSGSVNVLELTSPIWGRSEIEGRILCKEYNVKLHVVEKHAVEGKEVWLDQIVNSEGSRSMDSIDYNEENTIHIINRGNAHFEPILGTQEVRYNRQQSSNHDTPKEERKIPTKEKPKKKSRDSEQQSLGLSVDRAKRVDNDRSQAGPSHQSSSYDSQSDRGTIDSAQHQQINPNSPDFIDSDDEREKNTELFSAIKNGNLQKVQELLKAGVKVNIIDKNNKDNTPLHYAIEREKEEIAAELLQEWKADINVQNNKGDTPLHIATSKDKKELVQLLISKNANTNIKNNAGKSPLSLANELDNSNPNKQGIIQILRTSLGSRTQIQPRQGINIDAQGKQENRDDQQPGPSRQVNNPIQLYKQSSIKQQPEQSSSDKSHPKQGQQQKPKSVPSHNNRLKKLSGKESGKQQGQSNNQKYKYLKRSGTSGISGQLYETKLLMLILLRALNDEKINEFYLGTNVGGVGALDDIIFRYNLNGQEKPRVIFIQAKHKDDPGKDKVTVGEVQKKDGDFSLHKYLDSYLRIKQKFNPESDDIIFKGEFQNIDCDFVIYTPAQENFSEKKGIEQPNTGNFLIDTGKEEDRFQFEYKDENIGFLVKIVSESHTKILAENFAKFILSSTDNMMLDELIKSYHVVLAQKVVEVSGDEWKFRDEFFESKEDLLRILKKVLCEKIVYDKKSTTKPKGIRVLVEAMLENTSPDTISKLIGSVVTFDSKKSRLKFVEKVIPQEVIDLKNKLEEKEVTQEIVNEAIGIAGKEKLASLSFKVPDTFGNLDLTLRGNEKKINKRLDHLTSIFINLLKNDKITNNNVVKIDDSMVGPEKTLKDGEIRINGGIGGLVGNLLIFDEETSMLKFNNNEESLPKNAKQFFQKLKEKIEKENGLTNKNLDSYRFEINVKNFPRLSLIDEKHNKSLVREFLDKIKFYTNQAKEDRVEEILKQEISKYYLEKGESLFDIKTDAIFLDVHDQVQKWWKVQEEATYLTKNCNYFNEVKDRIINNPILNILRIIYFHKIEGSDIEFSSDSIKELKLENFVSDPNKQILNIIAKEKLLSAVKLVQKFKTDDFIDLDYLYSLRIDNDHLEKAIDEFKQKGGDKDNILIIHCSDVEVKRVDELYNRLSSIMQSNSNKKVILITQEQDPLAAKFKKDYSDEYIETRDEKNSLIDLTDDSQQKLLEGGKVIFQGKEVSLGTLVDDGSKHLIDGEVLSKLINKEKIEIGKAPTDSKYDDVKDYYIPRTFNRQVKIKEGVKEKESEFLVTDSNQFDKSELQKDQDIVLISDTGEGFKDLCDNHKKHIHWLKQEGDDLIWQQSYGYLSKLRDFIDTNEQAIQNYKPEGITDIKDRVVIISSAPGMGKSTVLNPLALKTKDSLWVIRINFLDYSTELKIETEKKKKLNEAEAIKFLYRIVGFQLFQKEKEETTKKKEKREQTIEKVLSVITVKDSEVILEGAGEEIKGLKLLEIRLFNNFYNQGRIVLLFDGLDEISPDYTEKVIELLKVLKNSKVEKLWITTRPYNYVQEKLEDQFSIFSYLLKLLLPEEQKDFLRKFWKTKLKLNELDEQRSGVFIYELLDKLPKSIGDKDFMSIPLHASMVAEVFKDAFKSFYDSNEQGLSDEHKREIEEQDLVTLYERFINIKFREIRFGEKKPGINTDDPDMKRIVEEKHKEFIEDHMKLALYAMFNEDKLKILFSDTEIQKINELITDIKQGKERTGIIEQVIDNKPRFIHRTFAEYFVVNWFTDNKDDQKVKDFLHEKIFETESEVLRDFFDLMLAKDEKGENKYEIHRAVLNNDIAKVQELLSDPQKVEKVINSIDKGGRIALHLAAAYGYSDIVQKLLDRGADVTIVDGIFGWYPFIYADRNYHIDEAISILKVAKVKQYYPNYPTLLVDYKFQDYLPRSLHSEIISLFKVNYVGKQTLLCIAAENGLLELTRFLLEQGADVNPDTDNRYTPLINAARKGYFEIVKALLEKGANVNDEDGKGMTTLLYAVRDSNEEMVKFLIQKGADVNDSNKKGNTPLHYACKNQNGYIRDLLIDNGAHYITNEDNKGPEYYIEDEEFSRETKELFKEKFSESDSQNPSSDEEYHDSYDEIDSDNSGDRLNYLLNKGSDPGSDLTPSNSDESDIEYSSVICSLSDSRRRKREAVEECLFTWEDVDEFNEEKDEKRDLSKIKIDSERFVSYIKDLPEEKQSQLIQLASGVKVTGESQSLVNKLISNQKVMNHLSRVGKISGMTMHGMMAKNVLADFLNGNYQGVAVNVGFIAGGQGFAKVAEAASLKGLKLASEGKLLIGQSLKAASPFLARGTSAFVIYDLVNQIKAFKNGTEEALVGVVGDSIYLGVDAAEIGVEVAEAFGVLEGVSSVTGPIGAAIGAVVFVGTDIYMAVKRVDKIDQIIHLTGSEKFVEGLRAFIGMKPEQYIEELMEKKQLYNQLVKQGLEYLKGHSDIQSYVFSTTDKPDLDSKVLLDRKRTGIRWSRARPDGLNEGRVFCLPQGNDEPAPDYGSYLCENAIGIFTNKTGDHTLINLGEGKDYAKGFLNSPNIFVVNNGSKEYYGGNKDDIFVLQAEYIKGHLLGEGGINTLDTTLFALQEEQLNIQLEIGEIADYFRDNWLRVCEINKVIGRANKAETITVACDGCNSNVKLIDGQSGNEEIKDRINIIDDSCDYQMQIVVRPNTVVYNRALKGSFDYLVPLNSSGSAELSFIYGPERFNVNNTFWFAYQAVDIKSIDVKYINVFNRTEHEVKFNFVESNKEFNVTISYSENPAYRLGKSGEIRIENKGNLYMLESSDKSSEEVIRDYLPVANRVSKMSFFIQSVLSNETVVIGSGNHEVIHNNPAYRSHLVGNGGENVYVIDSETKEVIIHDVDEESSVDTIDLRSVARKAKEVQIIKSGSDLLLRAIGEDSSINCTVRLKDGVEGYNKVHVIVKNVPLTISVDNNQWSLKPQPLMFEKDKEIIVVTGQDVEKGSEIITPRKGGNYKFVRSNGDDLMVTNAFDSSITKSDLCSITLSKFYKTPRMKTLFIKFADQEIVLKDHEKEISEARDINVVKREYKDQVYNDVFSVNQERRGIVQQRQRRHHRGDHSRYHLSHKPLAADLNNQPEIAASSGTRPSSRINDLFGWVKSFVGRLLSSKPELSKETSSTLSPISQVDARMDLSGTIMLLDVIARKFTGKQYISTVDQSIPLLEARGYALNITNRFEQVLNQTAIKSGISLTNLNFNPVVVQSAIIGKIINGKFSEIAKTLYSFGKEACPEFKQTDKFRDHLKSNLEEVLAKEESMILQQKAESPFKVLDQEVSRKVQLSKKPDTFLNGASVVQGISRAIN